MADRRPELVPQRPAAHLTPPRGWMNDPNGLCLVDGTWHAFYQHNPDDDVWGTIHWRHATSGDLTRWEDRGIALAPDELGQIFSGSIVIDHTDSAGFGRGAMVAVFTHNAGDTQCQSLASSVDGGATWQKYAGNPVLTSPEPNFRDPKVMRHGDGWAMALAVGGGVDLYRSPNLREWELTGRYSADVGGSGVWECPDLFALPTASGQTWVLTFCPAAAGVGGHGTTLYVIGEFDGAMFHPAGDPAPVDHGPDFYAMQTFHGTVPERPTAMAWLNSWRYAATHPSRGRRGVLSIPRQLEIVAADGGQALVSRTADEIRRAARPLADAVAHRHIWHSQTDRALVVSGNGPTRVRVEGHQGAGASVDVADDLLTVERFVPGDDLLTHSFEAPVADGSRELTILIDHGTLEAFAAGGATTMSLLTFTGPDWTVTLDGDVRLAEL